MSTHQTAKTQYIIKPDGTKFAYRRLGTSPGTPLLILNHFIGVMDKFDPLLINTLASSRSVITFDYAGVGLSNGEIATTIKQSANDAIQFLLLIGEKEVDILGFSLGGLVAQIIALNANPTELKVRKLILAGTTSSAGPDMINVSKVSNIASSAGAGPQDADIETFQQLFFLKNKEGRAALEQWWVRIHERSATTSGEEPATWLSYGYADGGKGIQAQSKQVSAFKDIATSQGLEGSYDRLGELNIPVFVANGKDDYMVPTINSFTLQQKVPNGQLIIYPSSGHGFLFQHAALFAQHAVIFLQA